MHFPRSPLPVNNLQSWLSRLLASTKRITPSESETIGVTNTPDGVVFEIKEHALAPKNLVSGFEKYEDGNGYAINTLVYVEEAKTYEDDKKQKYSSIPGTYICVSPVPPKIDIATLSNPYLQEYYSKVTQAPGVVYAPIVIANDTRSLAYTTEDGKGKYWHLIAPAVMVAVNCEDGNPVTTYAAMQSTEEAPQ